MQGYGRDWATRLSGRRVPTAHCPLPRQGQAPAPAAQRVPESRLHSPAPCSPAFGLRRPSVAPSSRLAQGCRWTTSYSESSEYSIDERRSDKNRAIARSPTAGCLLAIVSLDAVTT